MKIKSKKDKIQEGTYKKYLLAMYEKQISLTELAKYCGVSITMVSGVMRGLKKSKRIMEKINNILGIIQ